MEAKDKNNVNGILTRQTNFKNININNKYILYIEKIIDLNNKEESQLNFILIDLLKNINNKYICFNTMKSLKNLNIIFQYIEEPAKIFDYIMNYINEKYINIEEEDENNIIINIVVNKNNFQFHLKSKKLINDENNIIINKNIDNINKNYNSLLEKLLYNNDEIRNLKIEINNKNKYFNEDLKNLKIELDNRLKVNDDEIKYIKNLNKNLYENENNKNNISQDDISINLLKSSDSKLDQLKQDLLAYNKNPIENKLSSQLLLILYLIIATLFLVCCFLFFKYKYISNQIKIIKYNNSIAFQNFIEINNIDSTIISSSKELFFLNKAFDYQNLNSKLDNIKISLVYRATRDGDSYTKYYSKVEDFSNNIILIKTKKNEKFGGFIKQNLNLNVILYLEVNDFLFSINKNEIYYIDKINNKVNFLTEKSNKIIDSCQLIFPNNFLSTKSKAQFKVYLNENEKNFFPFTNGDSKFDVAQVEIFHVDFFNKNIYIN